MNVVFLDFNGVLDTYQEMDTMIKKMQEILKEIVQTMEAKIVISSSIKNIDYFAWHHNRVMKYLIHTLREAGLEVYDFTPKENSREEEITSYLNRHQEITDYCILEDDDELLSLQPYVIKLPSQMSGGNGLKEKRNEIMKILKKGGEKKWIK